MTRVGVLQGTYLGVYFAETCMYWYNTPSAANCQFCTTGVNVGKNEELAKKVEDVVEVAKVAREESGVTFTHFNTGYHFEDDPKKTADARPRAGAALRLGHPPERRRLHRRPGRPRPEASAGTSTTS